MNSLGYRLARFPWWTVGIVAVVNPCGGHLSGLQLHAFEANDRWNNTATDGSTGPTGTPVTLTWGLVDDGTTISGSEGTSASNLVNFLDTHIGAGDWMPIFDDAFGRLSQLSGLTYVYEPNNTGDAIDTSTLPAGQLGVRPDIRIGGHSIDGQSGANTLAYNYFPDHGDMVIDTDNISHFADTSQNYLRFRNTVMHEALHGVGIGHSIAPDEDFLMEPTIMTRFDGPQLDDVLGMHRLYGDVREKNGGNDTWSAAYSLGQVSPAQTAIIGQHGNATAIAPSQQDFVSIDGNSDMDFFSFVLTDTAEIGLDLRPQGAAYEIGPEGGTASSLDTRSLSDLTLTLLDTNGVTELGSSNAAGAGGTESLVMELAPGTYYAQITGAQNNVQLYELSVAVAGEPENLTWTGSESNVWDLQATANFDNGSGPVLFANADTVTFDDAGQEKIVSLAGSLRPTATIVDATDDYTLTGVGALAAGSLTKNGTGTLELATSGNSFAGPTQVNAGVLILSGDTSAMVSEITVASGATLVMDSAPAGGNSSRFVIHPGGTLQVGRATSEADVFPNSPVSVINDGVIRIFDFESVSNVSGTGDVRAVAEMGLLENNSYTGQTVVQAGGAIQPTDDLAFGSAVGNTVVEAGGFVIAQNDQFGPATLTVAEDFVLSGSGDGQGALQITEGTAATFHGDWTMAAGGAMIGVSAGSSLVMSGTLAAESGPVTLAVTSDSSLELAGDVQLGPAGLAKNSAGTVNISATVGLLGPLDVQGGTLELSGAGSTLQAAVRVAEGATLAQTSPVTWTDTSSLTG